MHDKHIFSQNKYLINTHHILATFRYNACKKKLLKYIKFIKIDNNLINKLDVNSAIPLNRVPKRCMYLKTP